MPLVKLSELNDALEKWREKFKAENSFTAWVEIAPREHRQAEATTHQAEATTHQAEITPQKSVRQDKPPAVPRENDLHILIERVCKKLMAEQKRFPKAREVFNAIRKRTEELDEDCIIIKITNHTIEWESMYHNTDTIRMASLANRISKIKSKLMKNNHR